jgi:hypothetical protein
MKKGSKEEQPKAITLLTSDEWDDAQYYISNEFEFLEEIAIKKNHLKDIGLFHNHILSLLERETKEQLIETGFEKVMLEDPDKLHKIVKALDGMGIEYKFPRYELPYGFPEGILKIRQDKKVFWIKPEIESALRALESINSMKKELFDKKAIMIFLKSFELLTNVYRAGCMNRLLMKEKSEEIKKIKRLLIKRVIIEIFEKNPHRPKTLGEVWNKIDLFAKDKPITVKKTGKKYYIETGKDTRGEDVVKITGDGINPSKPLEYARRSLQKFIDELKQHPSKITQ